MKKNKTRFSPKWEIPYSQAALANDRDTIPLCTKISDVKKTQNKTQRK